MIFLLYFLLPESKIWREKEELELKEPETMTERIGNAARRLSLASITGNNRWLFWFMKVMTHPWWVTLGLSWKENITKNITKKILKVFVYSDHFKKGISQLEISRSPSFAPEFKATWNNKWAKMSGLGLLIIAGTNI